MAFLHLPLKIDSRTGYFEIARSEENIIGARLKLFVVSGGGEYLRLPSPGIRDLWIQLNAMGVSSRFSSMLVDVREELEKNILGEVNSWLEDLDDSIVVNEVRLIPTIAGENAGYSENGIKFKANNRQYIFTFHHMLSGHGLNTGTVGQWNIIETIDEID
jgi:hypothetical protein